MFENVGGSNRFLLIQIQTALELFREFPPSVIKTLPVKQREIILKVLETRFEFSHGPFTTKRPEKDDTNYPSLDLIHTILTLLAGSPVWLP